MRSRGSSMRVLSPALGGRLGRGGAAAEGFRAAPADHRTGRRGRAAAHRVEQALGCRTVEIFIEIVVDLQDWRVDAGAEAFDFDQREEAVGCGASDADAEL